MNPKRIEVIRKFYNELGKEFITRKELYSTRDKLKPELPLVSVRWIEDSHKVSGKPTWFLQENPHPLGNEI